MPTTIGAAAAPWPSLIYTGPGVGLVGISPVGNGNQGARPSQLYLSTDLVHWTNVTPPESQTEQNGAYGWFEHASFLNATTGWVTTWSPETTNVTIYRTSDGGKTWSAVSGGSHSGAGGATVLIQLLSPATAFKETLEPTGPAMSLQVSADSGQTWTTVYGGPPPVVAGSQSADQGPFEMPMVFASASQGFASQGIPPIEPALGGEPYLFSTSDGGSTWIPQSPPLPGPADACGPGGGPTVSCLFAAPSLSDPEHGVLPATVVSGAQAAVAFDVTADGGLHWTMASERSVPLTPTSSPSFDDPLVSVASASTWWLLGWTSTGAATQVSTDAGAEWTETTAPLPAGVPVTLDALGPTDALLGVAQETPSGGITKLLVTTDSGRTWKPVDLSS
jgi:photosystem II stability/assembly factor-like uncharacterized protein